MRDTFNRQLEELNLRMVAMGALCEQAVNLITAMLQNESPDEAPTVADLEARIDAREREIESFCLMLLQQQQPIAGDLRTVSAALKMIGDLERIGDQARDVADLVTELRPAEGLTPDFRPQIVGMARAVAAMVSGSIDAFVRRDVDLARRVAGRDREVDAGFVTVKRALAAALTPAVITGETGLDWLMIAKYLERIGDHAVNVTEWVDFALTGRHKGAPG